MARQQGRKAIKRRATPTRKAATPKAGPKKRRTKAEMAEARKQEAIRANATPTRALRKSGKVKRFNFSDKHDTIKPRAHKSFTPAMQKPKKDEDIPVIVRWIDRHLDEFDTPHDAIVHFQEKVCEHRRPHLVATMPSEKTLYLNGCEMCGHITGGKSRAAVAA